MPRPAFIARCYLAALHVGWLAWMATTGMVLGKLGGPSVNGHLGPTQQVNALVSTVLAALAWALVNAALPSLAERAERWPVRVVGWNGVLGTAGLLLGIAASLEPSLVISEPLLLATRGLLGLGIVLVMVLPAGDSLPAKFFLFSRHASDVAARRILFGAFAQAVLVVLAVDLAAGFPSESSPPTVPPVLQRGAVAYLIGAFLSLWQRYPQRAVGFMVFGNLLAVLALFIAWIAPSAEWPILLLGVSLGFGHTAARSEILARVPPTQRAAALMIMGLVLALGAAAAFGIAQMGRGHDGFIRFAVAMLLTAAMVVVFLRDLIELAVEPILAVTNPIHGYGPGLKQIPTRGPVLVIANHAAWFDPLYLAKLLPLRVRPMMTARFFDLPVISFLMRRAFHSIRVQEVAYRREAPEIAEAIAALDRGENVMIFPEGWLRRKEEVPLKRFGQGVYQILREKPQTPVLVCWIEGNWGSFVSFWNGPPTKNKKFDILHVIRIGIAAPQILSMNLLHDHRATRRHLMLACLKARTYLGLPELPAPLFPVDEDADENGESAN